MKDSIIFYIYLNPKLVYNDATMKKERPCDSNGGNQYDEKDIVYSSQPTCVVN